MSDERSPRTAARPAPDEIEAGVPAATEMPRGIPPGGEDEEEPPPLDIPQGVESWGTTASEEHVGESVAQRAAREEPDSLAAPPRGDDGLSVFEPGAEGGIADVEPDTVGELDADREYTAPAEEAAMRIDEDAPGGTYDARPGYLDER